MTKRSKLRTSFPPAALPCPWLMFYHGQRSNTQTFYSVSEARFCVKRIPDISGKGIYASFHEWMVMADDYSTDCFLLNIISLQKIYLPPLEVVPREFWILSASPIDENCIVGFYVGDTHCITFCRPGDGEWVEHMFEPEIEILMSYTICKGKIYCCGAGHSLVILDIVDHKVVARHLLMENKIVTSTLLPEIIRMDVYIIESCEEIFLVVMSLLGTSPLLGASNRKIRDIDIFKLDLSVLGWVKVENLGDRTFFINKATNCISCSATKSGTLGNSIYFMQEDDESMYVFDVEEKFIYTYYPCPYLGRNVIRKQWVMPTRP